MYNKSSEHLDNLKRAREKLKIRIGCVHCGEHFTLGNITKHEKSCKSNPINLKECPVCLSLFASSATTCSHACANTYFRSGEDHPNWKDEVYRTTCFSHHNKMCVVCGETNIVEVHHLDEDKSNNKPENLIPLCPTHHQYWHSRFKYKVVGTVMEYITDWKKRNQQKR